jgi:hypothetical protein
MSLPINGNQYFTSVENVAGLPPQRVTADTLQCTFFGSVLTTAPTGPTGPFNTTPYAGQVVLAYTGAVGTDPAITGPSYRPGIYVYTGSKWITTPLTDL